MDDTTSKKTVKVLPDSELSLTLKAAQTSGEPVVVVLTADRPIGLASPELVDLPC